MNNLKGITAVPISIQMSRMAVGDDILVQVTLRPDVEMCIRCDMRDPRNKRFLNVITDAFINNSRVPLRFEDGKVRIVQVVHEEKEVANCTGEIKVSDG